jgi:hypothetical protein
MRASCTSGRHSWQDEICERCWLKRCPQCGGGGILGCGDCVEGRAKRTCPTCGSYGYVPCPTCSGVGGVSLRADEAQRLTILTHLQEDGPAGAEAIASLMELLLRDGAPKLPQRTSGQLRRLGSWALMAAVPALAWALQSPDKFARIRAARFLARLGPEARIAIPDLAKCSQDADAEVSSNCRHALVTLEGAK